MNLPCIGHGFAGPDPTDFSRRTLAACTDSNWPDPVELPKSRSAHRRPGREPHGGDAHAPEPGNAERFRKFLRQQAALEGLRMSQEIAQKLADMTWTYGDEDDRAYEEISRRVARAGRECEMITTSDLVAGLELRLDSLPEGALYIDTDVWGARDRIILSSFLGRLSAETYQRGRFFGSALVVEPETGSPPGGFWVLMQAIGAFDAAAGKTMKMFWAQEVVKAQLWYRENSR